jgi:hypothetical protein
MTTKKQVATLILMLVGLMGLANAQSSSTIKARVPFNFVVNGRTMAAGEYEIEVVGPDGRTLSIGSGKQHAYAFSVPKQSPNASKETALVFHRYGGRYFLTGIRRAGENGYQLPTGKLELELQARNVPEQDFTLIASAK